MRKVAAAALACLASGCGKGKSPYTGTCFDAADGRERPLPEGKAAGASKGLEDQGGQLAPSRFSSEGKATALLPAAAGVLTGEGEE